MKKQTIIMIELLQPKELSQDSYSLLLNNQLIFADTTALDCYNFFFYKCNSKCKLKINYLNREIIQSKKDIRKSLKFYD